MSRIDAYRAQLAGLADPEPFALAESGLPGPRGNLELIAALAETIDEPTMRRWASIPLEQAPGDQPPVVLVVAGAVGLGRLLADGRSDVVPILYELASDPRWRVREGVAMAFQRAGAAAPGALVDLLEPWVLDPDPLVQRAVVAALAEPALLGDGGVAARVVDVLDRITGSLLGRTDRRSSEPVRVLRQALGYAWSVAIVYAPAAKRVVFERWLDVDDPAVRWIVSENLKKARLTRLDAAWVDACRTRVASEPRATSSNGSISPRRPSRTS